MTVMRTLWIALLSLLMSQVHSGETLADVTTKNERASAPAIPEYLVYRHFLAWVGALDKKASFASESDPYKFAAPFSRARLRNSDLDVLRLEAKSLDNDLGKVDADAKPLIVAFREKAKKAAQSGESPPLDSA